MPKTHAGLADFFGVTRPSISRAFVEMQKENIISINKKNITIKNKAKLIEYLK
jgi:CRP-like cAMP-binding protein